MKKIYRTLVGSKMHGLDTPSSDEDVRYITLTSLVSVISPFKNETIKVTSPNGEDVESWELRYFVKHLTSGNPTAYEVIKSPLFTPCKFADDFRAMFPYFLDGRRVLEAHCGYANAQLERYLSKWNKLDDQGPNFLKRVPKAIVAAYRVLAQGRQLLATGDFCARVSDYDQELHTGLMRIKQTDPNSISSTDMKGYLDAIESDIQSLRVFAKTSKYIDSTPNIAKIEQFLLDTYLCSPKEISE